MENPELEITQNFIDKHGRDPSSLITILNEVQDYFHYLPKESLNIISKELHVSLAKIHGVITFYTQFKLTKPGKHIIQACHGTACYVRGAQQLTNILTNDFGLEDGKTSENGIFSLEVVACFGVCASAPVVEIDGNTYGKLTPKKLDREIKKIIRDEKDGKN